MKLKTNKLSAWLAALAFVVMAPMAPMAQAAQFVTDGEFDDPNLGAWITGGATYSALENRPGGTGGSAEFSYDQAKASLEQFIGSLNDLPSTIEFYLKSVAQGTAPFPDGFGVSYYDGLDLALNPVLTPIGLSIVGPVVDGWVHYSGVFSGFEELVLLFTFTSPDPLGNDDLTVYLDGVSITQDNRVPEPGTLALMGLALASIAVVRRRKA